VSLKLRPWLILVPAALLLGLSVWMQPTQASHLSSQTWVTFRETFAIRQGLLGVLALALSFGIGWLLPWRHAVRLWCVPLALVGLIVVAIFATNRNFLDRFLLPGHGEDFQVVQSLRSIQAGGLSGNGWILPPHIPEGHTDFIFGSLCGKGGLVMGMSVLVLTGVLLMLAWGIVARRKAPQARALAAGCAAALTVPPLLHIAVNIGLWPVMPTHFPFLSYGPLLLLLDGLLLGILLSLDREESTDTPAPSHWPTLLIQVVVALLIILFALRLGILVFSTPVLRCGYTSGSEQLIKS
jgi:cell division protein FtsW (lipid II flippase)